MNIEEFILEKKIDDEDPQDSFEFHDRHAIHIDDLNNVGNYIIS